MKNFLVVLSLYLSLIVLPLSAFDIAGTLSEGDGSTFIPEQGSAFSIVLDINNGFYSGEYELLVRSNGKVIYDETNQIDDVYLVFNESTNRDDIIKIDIKKGQFIFKMSKIEKLPDTIVEAIKRDAYKKYTQSISDKSQTEPKQIVEPEVPKKEKAGFFEALKKKLDAVFSSSKEQKYEEKETKEKTPVKKPIKFVESIDAQTIIKPAFVKKSPIVVEDNTISQYDNSVPETFTSKGVKIEDNMQVFKDIKSPPIVTRKIKTSHIGIIAKQIQKPSFKQVAPKMQIGDIGEVSQVSQIKQEQIPAFEQSLVPEPIIDTQIDDRNEIALLKAEFDNTLAQESNDIDNILPVQKQVFNQPQVNPIPDNIQRIVITKTLTPKKEKEEKKVKESSRVIKRHITPTEYREDIAKIPDRMSDRLEDRGGYGTNIDGGNLKVKAYSNNKEVSAWIEVFKAGTTNRVKTFYTGKGESLKDIKLPAGVYVIKATYRTKTSKKRKNLGKVVLGEGESINKSISFDGGKVKIIATRGGKPLYVKVEVFKKGTSKRVTYDFTSKRNGIAILNLSSGKYDIVVNDHINVLNYDNVRVRSGKTKVFNANF